MKFNIRHLIWLTAFAAILCCGIDFTLDSHRKAQRLAEIARANAEEAWENAKEHVDAGSAQLQSSTSVWVVDESGVAKQVVHGKPIVETYTAKVIGVVDGDTIKVLKYPELKEQIKVRLESIDCPESKQAFGKKAKQAVGDLVFGMTVTIQKTGTDRYPISFGSRLRRCCNCRSLGVIGDISPFPKTQQEDQGWYA